MLRSRLCPLREKTKHGHRFVEGGIALHADDRRFCIENMPDPITIVFVIRISANIVEELLKRQAI